MQDLKNSEEDTASETTKLKASPFPEHIKILESLEQTQVAWNLEFQALYSRGKTDWSPASTKAELQRTVQLRKLAIKFADHATQLGLMILKELALPDSLKVIKPVTGKVGGIAGGKKYVSCGIFFKQPCDLAKLYGSGSAAIKAAEHELKGTMAYLDCEIEGLHFPLMALIRYRGHALLAQALLPINADTIQYGTCDHAKTIHMDSPELNQKMEQAAKILNIKAHTVWTRNKEKPYYLYAPADVEGHLGTDNRFYIIDTARVFPPAAVRPKSGGTTKKNAHLYQLLRPELVKYNSVPLSSDAYSKFGADKDQHIHDEEVLKATIWLEEERIPEFARYLEKRSADISGPSIDNNDAVNQSEQSADDSFTSTGVEHLLSGDSSNPSEEIAHEELSHIVAEMHLHGINVRYLLQVYSCLNDRNVRVLVITEAISRLLKTEIAEQWRSIKSVDPQAYVESLVAYINLVFGNSEESEKFWAVTAKKLLLEHYPAPASVFYRSKRHSTIGRASNHAGSCSSEDEKAPSANQSLSNSAEETLTEFFIRVAIGLHVQSPEKFAKSCKMVVGNLCSTVHLLRELVESQYWQKKVFSQNSSDNDMIKTHIERRLPKVPPKPIRPRSRSVSTHSELKKRTPETEMKKRFRSRSASSMDRIIVKRRSSDTSKSELFANAMSHSGEFLKSSKELRLSKDKKSFQRDVFSLKKEVNLDLVFQRTMFLLGAKFQFGDMSETSESDSSSYGSNSMYGPVAVSNESKASFPKGQRISNFFQSGGVMTVSNIVDILPVVKHIHKISSEEGTALSRLALTHKGGKARRMFELANKRFEECIQIKPDDHFALYNWAFALRKQALLSAGAKARELWALVSEKYSQALVLHPRDWQALGQWGSALVMQAQQFPEDEDKLISQAYELLSRAADLAPLTHFKTSFNAGGVSILYARIQEKSLDKQKLVGILSKAVRHFETALDCLPSSLSTMQNLAIALGRKSRLMDDKDERKRLFDRSNTFFHRVHTKDPKNKSVLFHWGSSLAEYAKVLILADATKGNKDIRAAADKFRLSLTISSTFYLESLVALGSLLLLCRSYLSFDKSGRRAKYIARYGTFYLDYVKEHFFQKKILPAEIFQVVTMFISHQDPKLKKLSNRLLTDHSTISSKEAVKPQTRLPRRSKSYNGREQLYVEQVKIVAGPPSARFQTLAESDSGFSSGRNSNSSVSGDSPGLMSADSNSSFWERFKEKKSSGLQSSSPSTGMPTPPPTTTNLGQRNLSQPTPLRRKESWWKRQRSFSAFDRATLYSVPDEEEEKERDVPAPMASPESSKSVLMGSLVKRFSGVLKTKNTKSNLTESLIERKRVNKPISIGLSRGPLIFSIDDSGVPGWVPPDHDAEPDNVRKQELIITNKKACIFRSTSKNNIESNLAFAFSHPFLEKTQQIFHSKNYFCTITLVTDGIPFLRFINLHFPAPNADKKTIYGSLKDGYSVTPSATKSLSRSNTLNRSEDTPQHQGRRLKRSISPKTTEPKMVKRPSPEFLVVHEETKKPHKRDSFKNLTEKKDSTRSLLDESDSHKKLKRESSKNLIEKRESKNEVRIIDERDEPKRIVKKISPELLVVIDEPEAKEIDSPKPKPEKRSSVRKLSKRDSKGALTDKRKSLEFSRVPKIEGSSLLRNKSEEFKKRNSERLIKTVSLQNVAECIDGEVVGEQKEEPNFEEANMKKSVKIQLQLPPHPPPSSLQVQQSGIDRSWRSKSSPARLQENEHIDPASPNRSVIYHLLNHRQISRFQADQIKLYIAEFAFILDFFEEIGYFYQDFHPDHILLTESGHLHVGTFWEDCNGLAYFHTPTSYLSPEISASLSKRRACLQTGIQEPGLSEIFQQEDKRYPWWCLGIFFYIVLFGEHPFLLYDELRFDLPLHFPTQTDTHLKYFFELLLDRKIENRICSLSHVKNHAFFQGFDWEPCIMACNENNTAFLSPPFLPTEKELKSWKEKAKV